MTAVAAAATDRTSAPWRWVAVAGLLGAGGLHVAVTAEHLAANDLVVGLSLAGACTRSSGSASGCWWARG